MSKWIPVKERLPKLTEPLEVEAKESYEVIYSKKVLLALPKESDPIVGMYEKGGSKAMTGFLCCEKLEWVKPTHWMWLPKLPKKVKKK